MAAPVGLPHPFPLRSRRIAMLVIHGIGEQNPYETLDSFARGVFRYLRDRRHLNITLTSIRIALKEWTEVGMRIAVNPGAGPDLEGAVDIFEHYWAPETEDKLNWKDTLKWLIRTDLTPLRYFADNLQEMMNARQNTRFWKRLAAAFWFSLKLYAREVMRVLFLYLPLAAGLLWLCAWMSHPRNLWSSLQPLAGDLRAYVVWPDVLALACYALAVLMIWFMLQSLGAFLRRRRVTIQGWAEGMWFLLALGSALLFTLFGLVISSYLHIDLDPLWRAVWSHKQTLTLAVLAVGAAAFLRYALTGYVADVAVYVTSDAKSKNYAARGAILKGSTAALKRILLDPNYDHVVLAGHSLGSVIAYDTINELLVQFNGALGPASDQPSLPLNLAQLQKLKGLLTFGSPLDKIYYFFREHVNEDQAIRAQILSMLHSFRKTPSGRDYGRFEFQYRFPQLDYLVWINAYSFLDPVSARLKFYMLNDDDQRSFWYWVPGLAHLSYWGDPRFYSFLGEKLL